MTAPSWRIIVLKLEHRPERDKRLTTHVGLTARAFGAKEFWIAGMKDQKIINTLREVTNQWGQKDFEIHSGVNWRSMIHKWTEKTGEVIHLTMYGLHVDDVITQIRTSPRNKLVVVGGPKVPSDLFDLADYNVAIGHQPHSEVAALAIFLDRLFLGQNLHITPKDAKVKIIPTSHGKTVTEYGEQEERL